MSIAISEQTHSPIRPPRSSFRVPGRPAPAPPNGEYEPRQSAEYVSYNTFSTPSVNLNAGSNVPRVSYPQHGSSMPPTISLPQPSRPNPSHHYSHGPTLQSSPFPSAQGLGRSNTAPHQMFQPPPARQRSLSVARDLRELPEIRTYPFIPSGPYHAMIPESAAMSGHVVHESAYEHDGHRKNPEPLPTSSSSTSLGGLAYDAPEDKTPLAKPITDRRPCSTIIAITPSVGTKARCHYDPFARRRSVHPSNPPTFGQMPMATVYEASQRDRDSINSGVSGVSRTSGGSGVWGVFHDNVPWTVAERDGDAGSVRSPLSAYSAASVRITA